MYCLLDGPARLAVCADTTHFDTNSGPQKIFIQSHWLKTSHTVTLNSNHFHMLAAEKASRLLLIPSLMKNMISFMKSEGTSLPGSVWFTLMNNDSP